MESLHHKTNLQDLRFVLVTCLWIGFSIWWFAVPERRIKGNLFKILGYVCEVWTSFVVQHLPSRFDCGKPLNYTLSHLLEKRRVWSAWATNKSNKSNISICSSDYSKYGYIRVSIHSRLLMGLIKLWKRRWCKKRKKIYIVWLVGSHVSFFIFIF